MHIALLSPAWPLDKYPNGVVTYVHWMVMGLSEAGHRVSIFTSTTDSTEPGVYVLHSSLLNRARRWIGSRLPRRFNESEAFDADRAIVDSILAVHRTDPIDVIEMEESFGWAARVARGTSIPLVVKLHGPAFMSLVGADLATQSAERKIAREGLSLKQIEVWTSPSAHTLAETSAKYAISPAIGRHIPNPVFLNEGTARWTLDGCDADKILFVGRFDFLKGGDLVLKAFAQLLEMRPSLKLVMAGPDGGIDDRDGRKMHFHEAAAQILKREHLDRVTFLGRQKPDQICRLRVQAMVMIVASRWENQSYTSLEAMAQGCPLVSSDAGGQPEIIQDGVTGLLWRSGDVDDLVAKVARLLDDTALAMALGSRARQYVLEHHSPSRIANETLSVYRQAIALTSRA